jgi:cytochrome P450
VLGRGVAIRSFYIDAARATQARYSRWSQAGKLMSYDPFSPEVKRDPYPFYADLRRDSPVFQVAARGMWAVSRHADVGFALKRPDLFSSSVNSDRADIPASETLLGADPPAHTGLRKRVERSFTPRRIRALTDRMHDLARELTAAFTPRGACDIVASLAAPLPVVIIAELMGVDPARGDDFKRWADAVITRGTGRPSSTDRAELDARVAELKAYLGDAIEARRRAPGEDLLSALVRDEDGAAGLSPAQALNFAVLLLLGGSETTTNLIGNALRALFADAETLARVRGDRGLIPALVEETLRYDAPVQSALRRTTADVELAGTRIPAGAIALLLLGSANRDEGVFADAERFQIDRESTKHLAFGVGPHHCLGATLARMEAEAALAAVLALPGLRLVGADVSLIDSFVLRGPRALEIAFDV